MNSTATKSILPIKPQDQIDFLFLLAQKEIAIRKKYGNDKLLDWYYSSIGKVKKKLFDVLVIGNLPMIVRRAYYYFCQGLDKFDLINAGAIGLIAAINSYEKYRQQVRFFTFAIKHINQEIIYALYKWKNFHSALSVSPASQYKYLLIDKIKNRLEMQYGQATDEQILHELRKDNKILGKTLTKFDFAGKNDLEISAKIYLFQPHSEKENLLIEFLKDEKIASPEEEYAEQQQQYAKQELVKRIIAFTEKQNQRCAEIIKGRFQLEGQEKQTLQSLADRFHLTKERIRQIEASFLKKMKRKFKLTPEDLQNLFS